MTDVAIVGAGYVGLPLGRTFAEAGVTVVLVEVDEERVAKANRGESYMNDVPSEALAPLVESGRLSATTDYDALEDADAILIALPTPLSAQREPDLSIVEDAVREIAKRLKAGRLVVLESTTYPGTTRERVLPLLEQGSGLKAGTDFNLAFSPERVDPGREDYTTKSTPKVIGGITPARTPRAPAPSKRAADSGGAGSSPHAAPLPEPPPDIFP